MDNRGRLAALITFAGGLPVEQVLEVYRPAFHQLVDSGLRQEMADLDYLGRRRNYSASNLARASYYTNKQPLTFVSNQLPDRFYTSNKK